MNKLLICFFMLLGINAIAQPSRIEKFQIKGLIVAKETQEPLPNVIVLVINEKGDTINYTGTSKMGTFLTSAKKEGKYLLKFVGMGINEDSSVVTISAGINDIGVVRLSEGRELGAVKIFAQKYIMKEEVDRLIYDVTKDTSAHRVKMMDIMKKIPFMKVKGSDGKLEYLNENIWTIYINGSPSEMINGNRQYPMRYIKGDVMKTIEIIKPGTKDNPGETPIININLTRDLPNGFVGELYANTSNNVSLGGEADLIVKFDKLYFSFNYGVDYLNKPKTENETEKNFLSPNSPIKTQINNSTTWNNKLSHNPILGLSYVPNKKEIFRLAFSTDFSNVHNYVNSDSKSFDVNNSIIASQTSNSINKSTSNPRFNGTFNYTRKLDANKGELNFNMFVKKNFSISEYILTNNVNTPDHSEIESVDSTSESQYNATIIFKRNINKTHSFTSTASYTERKYETSSFIDGYVNDLNNGLKYKQQILSASVHYSLLIKRLSLSSSASFENNTDKGNFNNNGSPTKLNKTEFSFFPSVNINFRFPKRINFLVSYMARPYRPSINYLNPFIDQSDPKNIFKGNPNLKSNYVHFFTVKMGKRIGNNLDLGILYSNYYTNNSIEFISTIDNTGVTTSTYENIGKKFSQRISGSFSYFKKWLWIICSGGYSITNYTNDKNGENNQVRGFNFVFNSRFDISNRTVLEIIYRLNPSNSAQIKKTSYSSSTTINLSQTLVKEKLFMNLFINDPQINHKYISKIIGNDYYTMTTHNEQLGRIFGISIRWNFGHLKDKVGKILQPRAPEDLNGPEL